MDHPSQMYCHHKISFLHLWLCWQLERYINQKINAVHPSQHDCKVIRKSHNRWQFSSFYPNDPPKWLGYNAPRCIQQQEDLLPHGNVRMKMRTRALNSFGHFSKLYPTSSSTNIGPEPQWERCSSFTVHLQKREKSGLSLYFSFSSWVCIYLV